MKEECVNAFKIADNRFIFYDAFVHKTGYVCAIAPMYEELLIPFGVIHSKVTCTINDEVIHCELIKDTHKHTVVMKFKPLNNVILNECVCTFSVSTYCKTFTLKRSSDQAKFCVVSTTLKDCAPYLENWIIYHMAIGIEHFYIYDNNSNDVKQLKEIMRRYPTTYIFWPYPYVFHGHSGISGQTCAQNISIYKYAHQFICMTDVDEYIFSKKGALINELKKVDVTRHSGILLKCQWFGCSHQVTYTNDFLEKLVYKKETVQSHGVGNGPKGIICPDATQMYAVHRVSKGLPMKLISDEILTFNHYYTLTVNSYALTFRKKKCTCDIFDKVYDNSFAKEWLRIQKKKYAFVSIPKNGSQSVFSMLGYKIKDISSKEDDGIMDNHARAIILKERYVDYDTRFAFCFVRNPWERLVSWYDHHLKMYNCEPYKSMDFKTWVSNGCPHHWVRQNGTQWINNLSPIQQWQFIYDENEVCLVNRIFRMENFESHFIEICRIIGVPPPEKTEHKNKATKGTWVSRYDASTLLKASRIIEKDARLFGYTEPIL